MVYQGIKARRATLQAAIDRIDAGLEPLEAEVSDALTYKATGPHRADMQREMNELDRISRLATGNA